jgi:hypothetical protein
VNEEQTTAVVQRYLDELDGDSSDERVVRASTEPCAGCTASVAPSFTAATRDSLGHR